MSDLERMHEGAAAHPWIKRVYLLDIACSEHQFYCMDMYIVSQNALIFASAALKCIPFVQYQQVP
jgi:hypothetical protein